MKAHLLPSLGNFLRDQRGTTAIEYALIASFVSVIIVVAVTGVGIAVRDDLFGKVATALGS